MTTLVRVDTTSTSTVTHRIVICTTGGTIAAGTDENGALSVNGPLADLVAPIRNRLPGNVELRVREVCRVDSSQLGPADLDAIVDAVHEELSDPAVTGVVVTHGTDTLEETAILLDLHHRDPRPVVLTGAQRAADHPDADGPENLVDAVLIAAEPAARDLGVLLAFGRAVLQARGLCKWHTSDLVGFARNVPDPTTTVAPDAGPREVRPREVRRPVLPRRVRLADIRVDTLAVSPGTDAAALDAMLGAGARGVVIVGFGSGNLPAELGRRVHEILSGDPGLGVVVTSRVPRGDVEALYESPGGGAALARSGALRSGYLRAGQAWVLLSCLLQVAGDPAALRREWDRFSQVLD